MATKKKTYRLTFTVGGVRKQYTARTQKEATQVSYNINCLITAQKTGIQNQEATVWASKLPEGPLLDCLAQWGLVKERTDRKTLLDLKRLIEKLPGRIATKANRRQWFGYILDFKPDEARLADFNRETAIAFCSYIRERFKTGEAAERPIRGVKGFFKQAVLSGWIQKNPFEFCKTSAKSSDKPVCRITTNDLQTVLDACPNKKWRAIIVLMRFAGLRGGNELRGLDWSVDTIRWGTADTIASITVRPTKQAHIDKRKERIIPIPPIVETALLDWLKASKAEEKEKFPFVPMFADITEKLEAMEKAGRKPESNLNTPIKKIFNRAGVPITVAYDLRKNCCSDWLTPDENGNTIDIMIYEQMAGHTFDIGRKHYQQLFPGRLERGLESVAKRWQESGTRFGTQSVHDLAHGRGLQPLAPNDGEEAQTLISREYTQEKEKPCKRLQGTNLPPRGVITSDLTSLPVATCEKPKIDGTRFGTHSAKKPKEREIVKSFLAVFDSLDSESQVKLLKYLTGRVKSK